MPSDVADHRAIDPATLALLRKVFDEAWSTLEPSTPPQLHNSTRNTIATALMRAAERGVRDPNNLWCTGVNRARALKSIYRIAADLKPDQSVP